MKSINLRQIVFIGLASTQLATGAAVIVDWYRLPAAGSPAAFQLLDDSLAVAATGSLTASQGVIFSNKPSPRTLESVNWSSSVNYFDSITNLSDVFGMDVRVAPVAGSLNYQLQVQVPPGQKILLVVGDLFRNATSFTAGMSILAISDTSSAAVTLTGTQTWNNGVLNLNQDLAWNNLSGTISTIAGSVGDSKLAFLEIDPIFGNNPRLVLSVPNSSGLGAAGESIFLSIGAIIPEPSSLILVAICGCFLLKRKRHTFAHQ